MGFSLGASSAASQAGSCGPGCPTYDSLHATYNRDSVLATSLYIGAGALGVAALVTWLAWPSERSEARARSMTLHPYVGWSQAGVVGEF